MEDEVGFLYGLFCPLDAFLFYEVIGGVNACGIDDAEGDALKVEAFFDGVACGSWGGANDGAVEAEESIEEAGFAGVGTSTNGESNAFS